MGLLRGELAAIQRLPKPMRVITTEADRIPSRAKEATAFAMLAYQTFHRFPCNIPSSTGAARPVILGKIAYAR
jgi:anhydro-N-acetylmuramic acid kinase